MCGLFDTPKAPIPPPPPSIEPPRVLTANSAKKKLQKDKAGISSLSVDLNAGSGGGKSTGLSIP